MSNNHSEGHSHVIPIPVYFRTYLQLLVLMFLTVAVAVLAESNPSLREMSYLNNFVAMAIATTKAMLVVWIFMGVKYSSNLTKFYAFFGFVWFSMMFLVYLDYAFRKDEINTGWSHVPANALPRAKGIPGS